MPVVPVILAVVATAGSAATATAGAVAAGAAAAGAAAAAAGTAAVAGAAAITVTEVAAVGAAGIAVAAAKSRYDDSIREEAYEQGARDTAAKYDLKIQKILSKLEGARTRMADTNQFFSLLIALTAIGMATAYADGKVDLEEVSDLEDLVGGLAYSKLPLYVQAAITELKNNPPSFNTAMQYLHPLEDIDQELFENVIEVVALSDGRFCNQERALLEAFRVALAA